MSQAGLAPWRVSEADYPGSGGLAEQLRFMLGYAILAPSSHNAQPWLFRIEENAVDVCADHSRALPVIDPDGRELTISCGAALYHLRLAIRRFGRRDVVTLFPDFTDRHLLARVRVGETYVPSDNEIRMFDAIPKRHTNRARFDGRPLPSTLIRTMRDAAADHGVWFHFAEGADTRLELAKLVAEGDIAQGHDKRVRREIASWIRSDNDARNDGVPAYALGQSGVMAGAERFFIRWLDWGESQAEKDVRLLEDSAALAVLGTRGDTPANWLDAGQALARVLLMLRADGAWASFLNQPLEVPALRQQLVDAIAESGYPQVVLRMGYGPFARPTPRRAVSEVVTLPAPASF